MTAANSDDALREVIADIPEDVPVVVSIASEAQATLRLAVPAAPAGRAELFDLVHAHQRTATHARVPVGPGVALAGSFRPPTLRGGRWAGLVCAWPAGVVSAAYSATAGHGDRVRVVAPPLVAGHGGDLVLALRDTSCELTLSVAGVALATAVLHAGGLGEVEAVLGSGDTVGVRRTQDALDHGGVRDPLAAAELDRWLRATLDECATLCASWRQDGLPVPAQIVVHGRGATAVSLSFLMADVGLTRAPAPPQVAAALLKVPSGQRPVMTGAYLAAAAALAGLGDLETFADPDTDGSRARAAARSRRRHTARTTLAAATVLALCAAGPAGLAAACNAWNEHQLTAQERRLTERLTPLAPPGVDAAGDTAALVAVAPHLHQGTAERYEILATLDAAAQAADVRLGTVDVHAEPEGTRADVQATATTASAVAVLTAALRTAGATTSALSVAGPEGGQWTFTFQVQA